MPEITRTILARVRQYVGDRRHSKRQRVRLNFSLSLSTSAQALNGTRRVNMLDGYTSDISENGLALIVPQITLAEHHLVGENRSLNVKLQLPDGPVEVVAVPVRYERLEEDQTETGYLIGAKIISMPDADRERYSRYVVALQQGKILSVEL